MGLLRLYLPQRDRRAATATASACASSATASRLRPDIVALIEERRAPDARQPRAQSRSSRSTMAAAPRSSAPRAGIGRGRARRAHRSRRRSTRTLFAAHLYTAGMPDPDLADPHQRRAAHQQFPALAMRLCRACLSRPALARLHAGRPGERHHASITARPPLRRRAAEASALRKRASLGGGPVAAGGWRPSGWGRPIGTFWSARSPCVMAWEWAGRAPGQPPAACAVLGIGLGGRALACWRWPWP